MAVTHFEAKLSEKRIFNRKFIQLHFELISPSRLDFQAGQYFSLKMPNSDGFKSYSMSSTPDITHAVETVADISPGGEGSKYIEQLQLGDSVKFMAPLGRFVVDTQAEELVFLGAGSGITPLRSMLLDLLINKKDSRHISLYWGMRHAEDLFWEEDFYQIDKDYDNFKFELILSQPPAEWKLSKGHVADALSGLHHNYQTAAFFVCGGDQMVADTVEFLKRKQVPDELIFKERFF